jgi:hypothetical protein
MIPGYTMEDWMLPAELSDSGEHELGFNGGSGTRVFLCLYFDRYRVAPPVGSQWPGVPELRCYSSKFEPFGPRFRGQPWKYCKITSDYNTMQVIDDSPVVSSQPAGELLQIEGSGFYKDTNTLCDLPLSIYFPGRSISVTQTMPDYPERLIDDCTNCVNRWSFMNKAPGTLLFEGAGHEQTWDRERNCWIYKITYNFLWRKYGHNIIWRPPKQQLDEFGNPVTSGPPDYLPMYVDPPLGIGAWTERIPPLHESADFGPMMGMTPIGRR